MNVIPGRRNSLNSDEAPLQAPRERRVIVLEASTPVRNGPRIHKYDMIEIDGHFVMNVRTRQLPSELAGPNKAR